MSEAMHHVRKKRRASLVFSYGSPPLTKYDAADFQSLLCLSFLSSFLRKISHFTPSEV
jgi:hypothetical protein